MTERELSSLVFIRARIEKLEERIAEMEAEDGLGSVNMDGMPHGTTPGNPVERMAIARAALHEQLVNLKATLKERELTIQKYIDSVELEDVKWIMEMRFIDGLGWHDIASEWEDKTGKYADRTTLAKKVRKYLWQHAESRENSPISH
jgi:hypothetical protein